MLLKKTFFTGAEAEGAVYSVWRAVICGVEVAHLEFTEETNTEHLDAGEDKHTGDDEDGAVLIEHVTAGGDLQNEHPDGEGEAGDHAYGPNRTKEVEWARHVLEKKPDGEEVKEDAKGTGDAVVALPCHASGVGDRDFADGGAVPAGKGGDEAVHLSIQRNVLNDLTAVGLEGSTEVVDIYSGKGGHELVGGMRGDAAHEEVITALIAPAADNIVAFFQFGEKTRDLVRVVLQIAVHSEDEVALRVIEAGGKR